MIKIQEVEIHGVKYRIREPRLRDYLASKNKEREEVMIAFLSGMLVDENDKPLGEEAIRDLPLSHFGGLSEIVNRILEGANENPPLESKSDSGSASH